jgi:hypothetical protein
MPSSNIDWYFITEEIYQKKFTPIISNQIINNSLFGDHNVVRAWADNLNYPLADNDNLTRVAQFLSVTKQDSTRAKSSYLQFLKQSLLELARGMADANQNFLDQVKGELRGLTFSQLATERLRYPDFNEEKDNPLSILAALDIPVFLTTSYHYFMEAALKAVGKTPHTEVYCWQEGLEKDVPPEFRTDPDFEPDVQIPLVYHLHGIDDYPDSLVLTEDDYLEFLVNVTRDFNTDAIPSRVRNALSSSLLLLLGYDLHAWDLRVLLQGLIKDKPLRPRSFAIQLVPSGEDRIKNTARFQEYLQNYFGQVRFDVYWGDPQSFMKTLWEEWEKG